MRAFIAIMLAALILVGCGAKPSVSPDTAPTDASASVSEFPETNKTISYEEMIPLPQPVLVTSFGQSPDSMLAREMFAKMGVEFTFESFADPALIADHKSVVIVVGTSIKSLISIEIDPDKELERCQMFSDSIPDDIPVVAVRMGSSQAHTDFSDDIISTAVAPADIVVVTNSSDDSGSIKKAADELGKSYHKCSNVKEVEVFLSNTFSDK